MTSRLKGFEVGIKDCAWPVEYGEEERSVIGDRSFEVVEFRAGFCLSICREKCFNCCLSGTCMRQ